MGKGSGPAVRVAGLSKTYPGGVEAVRGVDFAVEPGEVFGLIGPNGAGKSTTVGMLTTAVVPSAGRAWVAGFDVAAEPIQARRHSAVVTQDPAVDRRCRAGATSRSTPACGGWPIPPPASPR